MQTEVQSQAPQDSRFHWASVASALTVFALLGLVAVGFFGGDLFPSEAEKQWRKAMAVPLNAFESPGTSTAAVTLMRLPCYGFCPTYEVTVSDSGNVSFNGIDFTCAKGLHQGAADPRQVRRLVAALVAINFVKVSPDWTHEDVTDHSTATVTVSINGTTHTVNHYHGDFSAPPVLNEVERAIDEVAGTAALIGFDENRIPKCIDDSPRA